MFPSRQRLKREDFDTAMKSGKRVSSLHFKAIVPVKAKGYAVVVPKKVARMSVTRHKIKRRVLSALRSVSSLPSGLILFPQATVAQMKHQDIKTEIAEILSKI